MNAPYTASAHWRRASAAYEAAEDMLPRIMALEAIEQLMQPQKRGSQEDLEHVDRTSLAWLLTIVNIGLRRCATEAIALADAAQRELWQQENGGQQP